MLTALFLVWLQMSAQPSLPAANYTACWYESQPQRWACIDSLGKITYPDWGMPPSPKASEPTLTCTCTEFENGDVDGNSFTNGSSPNCGKPAKGKEYIATCWEPKESALETEWGTKANGSCLIPSGPLLQVVNQPTALDDITRAEFAEAAQRAADETDGKPPKGPLTTKHNHIEVGEFVEPVDVPAVQVGTRLGCEIKDEMCLDHQIPIYSCADKSRVLLTSEDGKKHCAKF